MPTGWRPEDVAKKYPIAIIEDVYNFKKYRPAASNSLKGYAIFQMLSSTILMLFMSTFLVYPTWKYFWQESSEILLFKYSAYLS